MTPVSILCPACRQPNERRARFCAHCGHDTILNNAGPHYFITRVIKAGGQGAVYAAIDAADNVYAVKEMLDDFSDPVERQAAIDRFQAEARLLQSLRHPAIPRVYASFDDEGRHYLVMDFVEGEDLEELLEREGAQSEARVLEWADEICTLLAYLHKEGLIYRDIKPSNIMIQPDGRLKLIDFGIAKVFQPGTRGTQIGTPGYAPPEQYQGMATRRSDIYALGATLHHILSGRDPQQEPPFSFPPIRSLQPAISERTEAALQQALQMKAEDRFASMDAFRQALLPPSPVAQAARVAAGAQPQPAPANSAPAPPPTSPLPQSPAALQSQVAAGAQPQSTSANLAPAPPPTSPLPQSPAALQSQSAGGRGKRRLNSIGCLLGLLAVAGVAAWWFWFVAAPGAPGQRFVPREFTATGLEVVVPAGSDDAAIQQALLTAYLVAARNDCSCEAAIDYNQPITFLRGPERGAELPEGVVYRADIQATIRVPEP